MNQKYIFGLLFLSIGARTLDAMEQENSSNPKPLTRNKLNTQRRQIHRSRSDNNLPIFAVLEKSKNKSPESKWGKFTSIFKHTKQNGDTLAQTEDVKVVMNPTYHPMTRSESSLDKKALELANSNHILKKKNTNKAQEHAQITQPRSDFIHEKNFQKLDEFIQQYGFTKTLDRNNQQLTVQEILVDMFLNEALNNKSEAELDKTIKLLNPYLMNGAQWKHLTIDGTPIMLALIAKFPVSDDNKTVNSIKSSLSLCSNTSYTEEEAKVEQDLLRKQDGGNDVEKGLRKNQDLSRQRSQTLKEKKTTDKK